MSKTVLVTGGAGFIGSNFVRYLYEKYPTYRLLVLDALTYAGDVGNLPVSGPEEGRCEFWYGDVRNAELVDTLVSRSDVVVHMAAETHVTRSIYDNRLFFETDVLGTQAVANAVTKFRDRVERFIHISTSEVYGSALSERMDEDHPMHPRSPYASAKCGADRLVYSYWATYEIPAIIVRPFNNYGPRQHLEKMVPRFITGCILGEPLTVHGDGSAARDFIHVEDHVQALDLLMHAPYEKVVGGIFNLGSGQHISVLEMAKTIRERMNSDVPIELIGDRPGQVFRHTCDASRIERLLGWRPKIRLAEGLAQTIQWYRENESWWRPQMWMRHIPVFTASGKWERH